MDELLKLSVRMLAQGVALAAQDPGLIVRTGKWGWWLRAAQPKDQKLAPAGMCPTSPFIYLPATKMVAALAQRCVSLRRRGTAGRFQLSGEAQPLFSTGDPLRERVLALLASRHPVGPGRARRATTTAEAISRWLPAELIGAPGGDLVPASIITGRVARTARTQVHYGAVSHDTVVMSYGAAVESIDPLSHHQFPGEAIVAHLGDKRTPTDLTVRTLIADLARPLDDASLDAAERHLAMMRYTVALLTFALAHRGNRSTLPSLQSVHAETRFCWISDKAAGGQASRRLVWVCDTALDQLRRYEEHLDTLQDEVSPAAAQAIAHLRRDRQLATFDLTPGAVERWLVTKACRDALGSAGLPNNTGRHWLRSRLVGRCSTETLHAFYGHGPIEEGSWDSASTLDPAVYRADLARVLDPALMEIGWRSRRPSAEATAS